MEDARKFVPHREPLLLVDCIVEHSQESIVATHRVSESLWPSTGMPAYLGIEIIAQTIAALESARSKRADGRPVLGVLLGTRVYRSVSPAFATGETLTIKVVEKMADPSGFGAFQGTIAGPDGRVLAEGLVKVYRPDDFWNYIRLTPGA